MTNLPVGYLSQWDPTAGGTNNDCGPACLAMTLNFYGEKLTVNEVFKKTGAGTGLISWTQLQTAVKAFGYIPHLERKATLDRVKLLIDAFTPPILLVHYGSLLSTQDKKFKGGHFFLPVGYNNDGFFVNDSDFRAPIREQGDHHNYTNAEITHAWSDCLIDGNQPFSLLWIERKSGTINSTMSQPWLRQMFLESGVDVDKPESEIRGRIQDILDAPKKLASLQDQFTSLQKEVAFEIGEAKKFEAESQQYAETVTKLQLDLADLRKSKDISDSQIVKLQTQMELLTNQTEPDKVIVLTKEEYADLTSKNGLGVYSVSDLISEALSRILRRQRPQ